MRITATLAACILVLFTGCAAEPSTEAGPSPCDEAAERLVECELVSAAPEAECTDPTTASEIAESSCEELETELADSKADGLFDDLLCGLGFETHCPPPDVEFDDKAQRFNRYDLAGLQAHPEGGIFDPVDRAFFVGSLADGSVTRIDATTAELSEVSPPDDDDWRTLGVAIDSVARRLFVCALHDVEPLHGEVWEFDLETNERTRHDLTEAAEGGSCNDVAVGPDGIVYVTDREQPNVYRIDPSTADVTLYVSDEVLAPPRIGLGQNGIVVLPDGAGIITTTYLPPELNHITMAEEPVVTRIDVDGNFHDYSSLGSGADGMILHDGSLYVAFATELVRLDRGDDWLSVSATAVGVRSGMTDVIAAEGDLYLVNGQAVAFVRDKEPEVPFMLLRFEGDL